MMVHDQVRPDMVDDRAEREYKFCLDVEPRGTHGHHPVIGREIAGTEAVDRFYALLCNLRPNPDARTACRWIAARTSASEPTTRTRCLARVTAV